MTMVIALIAVVLAIGVRPPEVGAQQAGRAAIGAGIGVGGGVVITLSVIVARARFQGEYLASVDDLLHWQTLPMILTPATGAIFGWRSREALEGSVKGSVGGMLVGTALGAGVGWLSSNSAESPWAGGVIGAGVGLTIGGIVMGLRGWANDDEGSGEPVTVGFRVRI